MEYVNIVKRLEPEIFIIENVKNLINSEKGFFINQIYEEFQASLNSSDEEFEDDYEYYLEYEEFFEDEETCLEEPIVPKSKFEFSF